MARVSVQEEGGEKFSSVILDPDADGGAVAEEIGAKFGFGPMAASLFDDSTFYFYMTLQNEETVVQIPVPEGLSQEALKKSLDEGLKRFATGLLKTVVLMLLKRRRPTCNNKVCPVETNSHS